MKVRELSVYFVCLSVQLQYLTSAEHFLEHFVYILHESEFECVNVSALILINCLLRNEADIDERVYLREEFFR